MTLRRRVLDYSLAGLLLLLPFLILRSSFKDPEHLSRFDQAILRVSSPLQTAMSWVVEGVGGMWNSYVWLVDVEDENNELRRENEKLRRALAEARQNAADTKALERMVGLRDRTAADTLGARVVAAGTKRQFRSVRVRVDRGKGEVAPGMPVIDSNGLVGRIQRTYGKYSDVLLAIDPKSSVDVLLPRTGGRGVLKGLGKSHKLTIEYLEQDKPVEKGDLVVTSGLGKAFPEGIPVGTIAKAQAATSGLFQDVTVTPTVQFTKLRSVLIVLASPPPPDPSGKKERKSARARGVRPY